MKILLAIDDSKFSESALRMLLAQNHSRKSTVRVLHVVEPLEVPFYDPEVPTLYRTNLAGLRKRRQEAGRGLVDRAVKRIRAAGYKVDGAVRLGNVRTTVIDVASKWHADLIVMGSHGRKGLKRILLGSVSDYVARHAHCSVEIVRIAR